MRKTFATLDDVLIERVFQPMSDLIAYRFGIRRGVAAAFCTDIASFSWILSRAGGLSDAVIAWDATSAFLKMSLLLLGLVALISLRSLFRRAAGKRGNPLRPAMQPHRAVVLAMLVAALARPHAPDLSGLAEIGMLVFAASALYLGACAERPPVRRNWARLVSAS